MRGFDRGILFTDVYWGKNAGRFGTLEPLLYMQEGGKMLSSWICARRIINEKREQSCFFPTFAGFYFERKFIKTHTYDNCKLPPPVNHHYHVATQQAVEMLKMFENSFCVNGRGELNVLDYRLVCLK